MENELKITLIQANLIWKNAKENRKIFEAKINAVNTSTDIIILPEMFTTGFVMNPEDLAEPINGETVRWMLNLSKNKNSAICGSIIIKENDTYYNRFVFVTPDGEIYQYNKRHLFSLAGEHKNYDHDNKQVIIKYKEWKICPLICYDLRFPVWSRNVSGYDLLIYVANWPKPRVTAWNTLLKARAIENMSYTIGVNRTGIDGNGHEYSGNSIVIDELGNELTPIAEHKEITIHKTLSKENLNHSRKKFNFLNDQDKFNILL
jgi:omega-amidase